MNLETPSIELAVKGVQSLYWDGDVLVDWVGCARRFHLDKRIEEGNISFGYRFDAVTASPSRRFVAIFERLGTKGLLLENGNCIRELNRSFYHADVYDYPIVLFSCPNGSELLAHCPEEYNRIEIEDAKTGKRLTVSSDRKPEDFFHSRLSVNASGTMLLSAGWVWHPWNAVSFFDITEALQGPKTLDAGKQAPYSRNVCLAEETYACFQSDTRVLITSSNEFEDKEESKEITGVRLLPNSIACYDLASDLCLWNTKLETVAGTLMPVGLDHVIDFYEHPKLIELSSGNILHRWENLKTGTQTSCIHRQNLPPPALDPLHKRFAVADAEKITVVSL